MKLLLRCLSIVLLGYMLSACTEDVTSEEYLKRAEAFLEESDSASAVLELKNALQKDVNNSSARAKLGSTYFDMGEFESAEKELSKAYYAGADPTIVVPLLAQALLSLGEYPRLEALKLDGLDSEGRSIVQAAKGLSMLYRGNQVGAEEVLNTAMENDPRSPYADVAAARITVAKGEFSAAREQLKSIFEKHPEYVPAWNLLGDVDSAEREPKKAERSYSRALKFEPRSFDARLNRAMMRIYLKDFNGARKDMETLKSAHPAVSNLHPGAHFAWGIIQLQANAIDGAKGSFEKASQYSDSYPLSLYYLAAIELEKGGVQQALNNVYRFLGLVPGSVVGSKLAARLELEERNYAKVEQLLQPLIEQRPDDVEAINLLAGAMLAQGKSGEGVELLARVAELQPESSEAKARLGAGYLAAGEDDLGVATLKSILADHPGYEQADILLVLNSLRQGNVDDAIAAANAFLEHNPDSATSYNLLGRAYLAAEDREKAKAAFNNALTLRPGDPAASHSLADFALQGKDFEAARKYYADVLAATPDHIQTLMRVAASYALEGREQEMFESLDSAERKHPRAMEPKLIKARYFIAKGQLENVTPMLEKLTDEQKEHPDALVTLAGFQLASSRYNQAFFTLEKLTNLRPDVSQYHYMKAKAYAGLGDMENFSTELNRAVELQPDHFYAKIALARLALLNSNDEAFEGRLSELQALAPENPDVMKLEVVSAQKRGDHGTVGILLEKLVRQTPTTDNLLSLATHRQSTGNVDGAIKMLESWVRGHPDDVLVRERLASLYGRTNQMEKVLDEYREILSAEGNNVVALNNLAWYLLGEKPENALDYAERAYALAPESSSVLDTYALALLKNGKLIEARRTIDRAVSLTPNNPEIQFHSAQISAAEGDKATAIETLATLLKERPKFSEQEAAEALLMELQSGQ